MKSVNFLISKKKLSEKILFYFVSLTPPGLTELIYLYLVILTEKVVNPLQTVMV